MWLVRLTEMGPLRASFVPPKAIRTGEPAAVPYLEPWNRPPEFVLYARKSNGRRSVPRQRTITSGYVAKLGGVIVAEFTDADSTAFRKVDGGQPVRDGFASMLALLGSRPGLKVAAWHAAG